MRIIQLVTRNCVGGVQLVAQALDAGFRGAGHESSLWFFCGTDEETLPTPNSQSIFHARPTRFYYPRLLWRLLVRLWRESPDVVIAHTTNTAVPGLLLAALVGIRKRVVVQHNPLDTYSKVARTADRMCADLGVYWRNVTVANTVTRTTTDYSAQAADRVRTIYNGIRLPEARAVLSAEERAGVCRQFGLPLDVPLIATIGRLAEQKNQVVLVEAMRSLEEGILVIAGDGPLRDELRASIAAVGMGEKVRMLGSLHAADVRTLIRASGVFVTSSHFEAMPMVVLEAMQEGAVIVASDIDAHRELLGDGGILVPASAIELREAIARALNDAALRERLSEAARARANQFSEEAMIERYLMLMQEDGAG